ncbi:Hypothetical predicted protein [Marmota monax]|uniref:Uncharacterized protein n=1 Tax=Marmota monax TaxID=9995 RepID=A0A5E4A2K4_MARMO|nr:Hypothetical predicted protein [Marmota monax]
MRSALAATHLQERELEAGSLCCAFLLDTLGTGEHHPQTERDSWTVVQGPRGEPAAASASLSPQSTVFDQMVNSAGLLPPAKPGFELCSGHLYRALPTHPVLSSLTAWSLPGPQGPVALLPTGRGGSEAGTQDCAPCPALPDQLHLLRKSSNGPGVSTASVQQELVLWACCSPPALNARAPSRDPCWQPEMAGTLVPPDKLVLTCPRLCPPFPTSRSCGEELKEGSRRLQFREAASRPTRRSLGLPPASGATGAELHGGQHSPFTEDPQCGLLGSGPPLNSTAAI